LPLHRERTYGKNRRTTVKNLLEDRARNPRRDVGYIRGHIGIVSADRVQGQKNPWLEPQVPANDAGCQQSYNAKPAEPAVSLGGGSGISLTLAYR